MYFKQKIYPILELTARLVLPFLFIKKLRKTESRKMQFKKILKRAQNFTIEYVLIQKHVSLKSHFLVKRPLNFL